MTNPTAALRMLITYAIVIPAAVLVGYLLTNPLDYGTLGFLGFMLLIIVSPVFIKWHYPILVFGLSCPMTCFFLIGKPPLWQLVVLISLTIAIVERTLNSERRFIRVPAMTGPLLFIAGMAYVTAELTGGIGLHALGGDTGGGKKYINVFVGVATYFALTSREIPRSKWKWYLALYMLPAVLGLIGDLFPYLPSPLNTINLLFPPTQSFEQGVVIGTTRLASLSFAVSTTTLFLLARYGLRGIFDGTKPWLAMLFLASLPLSMLGGFRSAFGETLLLLGLIFFLEGLHRTRLFPLLLLLGVVGVSGLAVFSNQLPYTMQRSMCFLPFFKWDGAAVADAEGSSEWRYAMWRDTWPKVPDHLLLGKGCALSQEDFQNIGTGEFSQLGAAHIDASNQPLAISGDYHSGPLSTLMLFGIWGAIGIVWLMAATLFVLYRNYRYGDPQLQVLNAYLLASGTTAVISFLFIFGAFTNEVGNFAKMAGFSIAMNWGVARRAPKTASNPLFKPLKPQTSSPPQTA
jgi:hypothetical protein